VDDKLLGVIIGGAIACVSGLSTSWLNHWFTTRRDKAARQHDLKKERIKWTREKNLPIYADFAHVGKMLARNPRDDTMGDANWPMFENLLYQIELIGTQDVRDAAQQYETMLFRYRIASRQNAVGLTERIEANEAAYANWEAAERRFYDVVRRERGEGG
jgi:hypothetical protein